MKTPRSCQLTRPRATPLAHVAAAFEGAAPRERVPFPPLDPSPADTFRAAMDDKLAALIRSAAALATQPGLFGGDPPRQLIERAAAIRRRAERARAELAAAELFHGWRDRVAALSGALDDVGRRLDPGYRPRDLARLLAFEGARAGRIGRGDAKIEIAKTVQLRFPGMGFEDAHGEAAAAVEYQRGREAGFHEKSEMAARAYSENQGRRARIGGRQRTAKARRRWMAWRKLHRNGSTISAIARHYGVSRAAVRKGIRNLWRGGGTEPYVSPPMVGLSTPDSLLRSRSSLRSEPARPMERRAATATLNATLNATRKRRGKPKTGEPPGERVRAVRAWIAAQTVRNAVWRWGGRYETATGRDGKPYKRRELLIRFGDVEALRRWGVIPEDRPTPRQIAIQYRRPLADVRAEAVMPRSLDDPWGRKGAAA